MGQRARILVHTEGDPPTDCIWLFWGGDRLEELVDRFRTAGIGHSTSSATARAFQIAGNWLDGEVTGPSMKSMDTESPVPVAEAHTLAFGTDHGVLVYDWQTGEALVVKQDSVEEIPS